MTPELDPAAVLDFWFGQDPSRWFTVDAAFDAEIGRRFGHAHEAAKRGAFDHWAQTPDGGLALIILLDQFARNIHRGTAQMFAADSKALALARRMVDEGSDMALPAERRSWIYLPFMHSEALEDQELCAMLSRRSSLADSEKWAEIHAEIIRKFGRFPHRNHMLGRQMTPEEQKFLDEGGFAG